VVVIADAFEAPLLAAVFRSTETLSWGTEAFLAAELKALYPTHDRYVAAASSAAAAAQGAVAILAYRVKEYVKAAQNAAIPA
jgi:hypothetical protein